MYEITGTIVHVDLEGGFWAIEGDDGEKYCPLEMPDAFKQRGARVRAKVADADVMTTRMWGFNVEVHAMERLTD